MQQRPPLHIPRNNHRVIEVKFSTQVNSEVRAVSFERQHQYSVNTVITIATFLSLNIMESLQIGLKPHAGATQFFSITEVLLASLQR